MAARVIQLKTKKKSCMDCQHVFIGSIGLYCGMYREEIWQDSTAEECGEYKDAHN